MYLGRYMGLGGRLCMQNRSQTAAKQRSEKKQQQAGSSRIQRVYDCTAVLSTSTIDALQDAMQYRRYELVPRTLAWTQQSSVNSSVVEYGTRSCRRPRCTVPHEAT